MEIHKVAEMFPMMDKDQFESLKKDIARNGQLEAIWTFENKIIDGRNRYRACIELGISATFRTWSGDGSLVSFVWSLNGERRHLTSIQRAAIAVEALPMIEAEAKERQKMAGGDMRSAEYQKSVPQIVGEAVPRKSKESESATIAAKIFGTNPEYVRKVKRLKSVDPEKFEAIKGGKVSFKKATMTVKAIKAQNHTLVVKGKKVVPFSFSVQLSDLAISQLERIQPNDPKRVESLIKVRNYIDSKLKGDK